MFSGEVRQPHTLGVGLKSILIIGGARSDERCFTPDRVGDNQKVEFLLYRQGQNEVY